LNQKGGRTSNVINEYFGNVVVSAKRGTTLQSLVSNIQKDPNWYNRSSVTFKISWFSVEEVKYALIDAIDKIFEGYYAAFSLVMMMSRMRSYREDPFAPLHIPEIGLTETDLVFDKIIMYGMVRNEKLYAKGTFATLDFLNGLKDDMGIPVALPAQPVANGLTRGGGASIMGEAVARRYLGGEYDLINAYDDTNSEVDTDTVTWFMEVIGIIVLKIMRVMYYEKEFLYEAANNEDRFVQTREYYNTILKEYIVTMVLSVGLYLAGNTRMFFAVMFDLIMSTLIMMVTKNEKASMFPIFLAVYMFNFK